jgi:hypothetical protein
VTYDELAESKKANEIQTAIRDILLANTNIANLVGNRVYIDDISETIEEGEDPEAGALLAHIQFPAIKIYYTGSAEGENSMSGFTDVAFKFLVRALSEEIESNKGKKEVRQIAELSKLVLQNNFTLNGTCYNSDWMNQKKDTETKYGSSVDRDNSKRLTELSKVGDIVGIVNDLIPMNYV